MGCSSSGQAACTNSTSGCRGGADSGAYCAKGLTGPFCALCADSNQTVVYESATRHDVAKCGSCDGVVGKTVGTFFGALACLLVALLLLVRLLRRPTPYTEQWVELFRSYWVAVKPETKLKIAFGFYAIVTKVEAVYEVTLTAQLRLFLSFIDVIINVGLGHVGNVIACLGMGGYLARLLFWTVLPLGIIGIIFLGAFFNAWWNRRLSPTAVFHTALPLLVRILFILYPAIANTAFEALSCYPAFEDGRRFLIADVAIECGSHHYHTRARLALRGPQSSRPGIRIDLRRDRATGLG